MAPCVDRRSKQSRAWTLALNLGMAGTVAIVLANAVDQPELLHSLTG
jgi:hypothetical protein